MIVVDWVEKGKIMTFPTDETSYLVQHAGGVRADDYDIVGRHSLIS